MQRAGEIPKSKVIEPQCDKQGKISSNGVFGLQLPEVHKEIFRVLKPGGSYVSQEWVSTPLYDDTNEEHKRIIEEINFGNSLPNMRTWTEAEASGKSVRPLLFHPCPCFLIASYHCFWAQLHS
jgi:hypothetical protein